ncbi:peptidoglycan editing factor PgeF [Paenibacillus sp. MMS18-CY102]|uniref:peptidoglycan editing factor PgeF n=1 Tax=Paenibacillus sp. MMS18-CY102 TaxID=2682849 RepID=UPI0013667467|nr:peptidoglycan editing factor PgeF [Paenibacillus sp. MMS18-CY102]MWC27427.1 peptidoglycan editing factor PgeF [Paenibacillus sp. MMS18-CY102]
MEPFVWDQASGDGASLFTLSEWVTGNNALTAGFTTRLGGVSREPWASFNMGLHVGDRDEDVVANRQRLAEALGWPFEAFTCAEQVHGDRVHAVTAADAGRGRDSRASALQDTDALITNERGVLLASFYADCVPLYFWDPAHEAIGLAHAGWKGTAAEIAARTIEAMHAEFSSEPAQIRCAIGPAIGSCCYEVDGLVIERMEQLCSSFASLNGSGGTGPVTADLVQRKGNGKAMLDLKEINRHIMIKAGILPIHIELSKWCSSCRTDLLFSHRAENGSTGRMASWIGMEKR